MRLACTAQSSPSMLVWQAPGASRPAPLIARQVQHGCRVQDRLDLTQDRVHMALQCIVQV